MSGRLLTTTEMAIGSSAERSRIRIDRPNILYGWCAKDGVDSLSPMRLSFVIWAFVLLIMMVMVQQWTWHHLDKGRFHDLAMNTLDRIAAISIPDEQPVPSLPDGEVAIPLKHTAGVWVLPVVIDELHEANLVVDSGAAITILSEDLAFDLGLLREPTTTFPLETANGTTRARLATVRSLAMGDIRLSNVSVAIVDLSNLGAHGIDGLLGSNILKAYTWRLDHRRHRLVLSSS